MPPWQQGQDQYGRQGQNVPPWERGERIPPRQPRPDQQVEHAPGQQPQTPPSASHEPPSAAPGVDPGAVVEPYTSARQDGSQGVRETRTVVEHSTPLWRLVAVVAACAALGVFGYYLNLLGRVDDAATVLVITIVYTVTFWASRHPARLQERLGPFGKIGRAINESQDDLRRWVIERTLLAGFLIALLYGVVIVVLKHIVAYLLSTLVSPWLGVALGLAIGAAVVAPELWRSFGRRITGKGA